MREFVEKFSDHGIKHGGVLLFTPDVALGIIEAAQKERIVLLGFDAFLLKLNSIQPSMEFSRDYSYNTDGGWDVAKKFILSQRTSGFLFELVFNGPLEG